MEVSCQLHALAALPPGKERMVPIGYEAGWSPSRSRRGFEEKNSQLQVLSSSADSESPRFEIYARNHVIEIEGFLSFTHFLQKNTGMAL
jgi:hypothetical protein